MLFIPPSHTLSQVPEQKLTVEPQLYLPITFKSSYLFNTYYYFYIIFIKCTKHYSKCYICINSLNPQYIIGIIIVPILCMRKQRHQEMRNYVTCLCHNANKGRSMNSNGEKGTPVSMPLIICISHGAQVLRFGLLNTFYIILNTFDMHLSACSF